MAYINKSYLSTQFANFATKITSVFAKKTDIPTNVSQFNNDSGYITSEGTAKTISDVLPISKGGTGQTTGVNAANALINSLSTRSSTPTDSDYYISQYVGGGTTTTTYHRRPMSALWTYIKSKLSTVATSGSYNDLSDIPTIPTVGNGTITITQNGTSKGTFTTNQSGNTTIALTDNNTTYSTATTSSNGLMSSTDKSKLDDIDSYATNIPFIVGTQTATTGTWTGTTSELSTLVDGQTIRYWLPYNGSGNATLNLTLSDGTTTGAVNCYWKGTTRLTTHYGAGTVITLTYRKSVTIGGSGSYTGWWADADFDSDSYYRLRYQQAIKCGTTAIVAGNIIVGNNGLYKHLKLGNAFDVTYPILYAGSAISASSTGTNNYVYYPFTITTTQSITLTAYKPIFIKGNLSGTTFTPISTTPLTQTVPTSADGYEYILLGVAYSTTAIYLLSEHPIFAYKGGAFGQISSKGITDLSVSGQVVTYTRGDGTTGTITLPSLTWNE